MSVISDLQSKIESFKLIVEANSITPTVVGNLLAEIVSELDNLSSSLTNLTNAVNSKVDSDVVSALAEIVDAKADLSSFLNLSNQVAGKLDKPIVLDSEDDYEALKDAGKLDENSYYCVLGQ